LKIGVKEGDERRRKRRAERAPPLLANDEFTLLAVKARLLETDGSVLLLLILLLIIVIGIGIDFGSENVKRKAVVHKALEERQQRRHGQQLVPRHTTRNLMREG